MYRQGDLLFIKTDAAPTGVKKHSLVVLGSSITGHDHAITAGEVWEATPTRWEPANFYVVIPPAGADLIHPEHKTIALPGGTYEVRRQREVNGYVKD